MIVWVARYIVSGFYGHIGIQHLLKKDYLRLSTLAGGDADTNAAVVCAILGAVFGFISQKCRQVSIVAEKLKLYE